MDPRDRLRQWVGWGAAAVAGVAILAGADILPAWTITVTGDVFVDRVVSVAIWAMFAAVFGGLVAKVLGKIFRDSVL